MQSLHHTTVEMILRSISHEVGDDGMKHSFMFGTRPNAPHWEKNLGTEIFFSYRQITLAALYVRSNGPLYLRALSVDAVRKMLTNFVSENFHGIGGETFFTRPSGSFDECVSEKTKQDLASLLASSSIFVPAGILSLFPLVPVRVSSDFSSASFFVRAPCSLLEEIDVSRHVSIQPECYPPIKEWTGNTQRPSAWLGARSPHEMAAVKMRAAILGAVSLTIGGGHRHMFSRRKMFGGVCTIDKTISFSMGEAHTPPLMNDIYIREADRPWLEILSEKLTSDSDEDRRHVRALEYYYRAWPLSASERFPIHCMALDAVYGEASQATASIVEGVRASLGANIDASRLRDLMRIRGSVIHGGAPDVYDSRKYAKYWRSYGVDPIGDLSAVVTASLKRSLFGDNLTEQDNPDQEIIEKLKDKGQFPQAWAGRPGILHSGESHESGENE